MHSEIPHTPDLALQEGRFQYDEGKKKKRDTEQPSPQHKESHSDKSNAANLRLSAFIRGLIELCPKQPNSFLNKKCQLLLFIDIDAIFESSNIIGGYFHNGGLGDRSC